MFLPRYDVYYIFITEQTTAKRYLFVSYKEVVNFASKILWCGEKFSVAIKRDHDIYKTKTAIIC